VVPPQFTAALRPAAFVERHNPMMLRHANGCTRHSLLGNRIVSVGCAAFGLYSGCRACLSRTCRQLSGQAMEELFLPCIPTCFRSSHLKTILSPAT